MRSDLGETLRRRIHHVHAVRGMSGADACTNAAACRAGTEGFNGTVWLRLQRFNFFIFWSCVFIPKSLKGLFDFLGGAMCQEMMSAWLIGTFPAFLKRCHFHLCSRSNSTSPRHVSPEHIRAAKQRRDYFIWRLGTRVFKSFPNQESTFPFLFRWWLNLSKGFVSAQHAFLPSTFLKKEKEKQKPQVRTISTW